MIEAFFERQRKMGAPIHIFVQGEKVIVFNINEVKLVGRGTTITEAIQAYQQKIKPKKVKRNLL